MNLADEIIKRAIVRVEAGWSQWESSDKTKNNVCLTYALNEAADEVAANMPEMPAIEVVAGHSQQHVFAGPDQALMQANQRVTKSMKALYPGRDYVADSMISFNDSKQTTQAEVVSVLQHALQTN